METKDRNSRRRDVYNIDVHRASPGKHLKTEKHLEIRRNIPTNFFIQSNECNINKKMQPLTIERNSTRKIKKIDKQLENEIAKKRIVHNTLPIEY